MDDLPCPPSEDLEMYRPYLLCLARQQLDRRLQSKVDVSGIVNQTLKSKAATAGLLYRGLNALRERLSDSERG